jgi:hypothetical protein
MFHMKALNWRWIAADEQDELPSNPIKGIVIGVVLGLALWAGIIYAVVTIVF